MIFSSPRIEGATSALVDFINSLDQKIEGVTKLGFDLSRNNEYSIT
jgi:hypothetical protein